MSRLKQLVVRVHRHSLWQALAVYLGASFGVLGVVDLFIDYVGLPSWLIWVAFTLLVMGLPVVVVTSLAKREVYGEEVPAEDVEAAAEEDRQLRVLTWRTAGLSLMAALATWGVIAVVLLVLGVQVPEIGGAGIAISPNRIAVLPFSYSGGEESAGRGEDMVYLLSTTLDGEELRTVSPQAVFGVVAQEGGGAPDPERGNVVAERVGAGRYLLGDVVEAGGRLRISARLYDTGASGEDHVTATVEGEPDSIYTLVDSLSAKILVDALGLPGDQLAGIAARTTESLAALKLYLEGKREFRASGRQAAETFLRAVEIDSTFALAWYELSSAATFGVSQDLIYEAAENAVRYSDPLPWRVRQLIEANAVGKTGAAGSAEELYRAVLARHPDDVEAWFGLASEISGNPFDGRPRIEAREAYERGLALEPGRRAGISWGLLPVVAGEGDWAAVDSLRRLFPDGKFFWFWWEAVYAYGVGDVAAQEQVMAELERSCCGSIHMLSARFVAITAEDPRAAREIALMMAEGAQRQVWRVRGRLQAVRAEVALGRLRAAEAQIDLLAAQVPEMAIELEAYWSLPPILQVPRARLEAMRDSLARWGAEGTQSLVMSTDPFEAGIFNEFEDVHPHLRLYLLGRLSTRLGDHEAALAYADELEIVETPERAGTLAPDLAQGIRAYVLRNQGRAAEALNALEQAQHVVYTNYMSEFYQEPHERYLRGELLAELGRLEEALSWYKTLKEYRFDVPLLAPSHLRRAEIYERLGDRENARLHYNRFIELWADADPELQPEVEAARRALASLTSER